MRNELSAERRNAFPSNDWDVLQPQPCFAAQGLQGEWLYQQALEVGKYPSSDDKGGILVLSVCLLIVSVTGSEVVRSLERVFLIVITSISICSSIIACS